MSDKPDYRPWDTLTDAEKRERARFYSDAAFNSDFAKDPPTNITEIVEEQNRKTVQDFNRSPYVPVAHENVVASSVEEWIKHGTGKYEVLCDGSETVEERIAILKPFVFWTCTNHPPASPVPDIPKGENCPVCGGRE
jgi:hypothetical protein